MKLVASISEIKQGKDMNLEAEDPTREIEVEVESQSTDVKLVTNSVIDPMSAPTMIMQDKGVVMFPKEVKQKHKHLR